MFIENNVLFFVFGFIIFYVGGKIFDNKHMGVVPAILIEIFDIGIALFTAFMIYGLLSLFII